MFFFSNANNNKEDGKKEVNKDNDDGLPLLTSNNNNENGMNGGHDGEENYHPYNYNHDYDSMTPVASGTAVGFGLDAGADTTTSRTTTSARFTSAAGSSFTLNDYIKRTYGNSSAQQQRKDRYHQNHHTSTTSSGHGSTGATNNDDTLSISTYQRGTAGNGNNIDGGNNSFFNQLQDDDDDDDDDYHFNNDDIDDSDNRNNKKKNRRSSMTFFFSSIMNNNNNNKSKNTTINLRRLALELSLYMNLIITFTKLIAYIRTLSLSVLAALLDSVLDVVSQAVLNYTEKHSTLQRSSAFYPAGASRLEPIGVLTCAALMGMASFEVLKESFETLFLYRRAVTGTVATDGTGTGSSNGTSEMFLQDMTLQQEMFSFWSMVAIVFVKLLLLAICQKANNNRHDNNRYRDSNDTDTLANSTVTSLQPVHYTHLDQQQQRRESQYTATEHQHQHQQHYHKAAVQLADPTLEAMAQDHWNDALSNGVAAVALLCVLYSPALWYVDPVGAIVISIYIIYSWYHTGREQIEQLTGKSAPTEFIEELMELAEHFDERILVVDTCRAYHFGPKFLVELEIVMPRSTLLKESHDLGMELQYEIEAREEVERCFVHIDYETRDYDEHVVSKVPELREHLLRRRTNAPPPTTTAATAATEISFKHSSSHVSV